MAEEDGKHSFHSQGNGAGMSLVEDARFERLLRRFDDEQFHGYRVQYPPIAVWPFVRDADAIALAWRAERRRMTAHLYVNLPHCKTRCTFCFLPVVVTKDAGDIERYLTALKAEMTLWSDLTRRRRFKTLYIGGGTPSLLDARQIDDLFAALKGSFRFTKSAQIAFEANPLFLDGPKATQLARWGVNWLSLGVQSLHPEVIRRVDRAQNNAVVFYAYAAARKAGIQGVNIDLLCGLEGQSEASFLNDVRAVAAVRPDQIHLNVFEDTKATLFRQRGGRIAEPKREQMRRMQALGAEILRTAGYTDIDDESFSLRRDAQNEQASIDSVDEGLPLLGIGAGAVSYLPGAYFHAHHHNLETYRRQALAGRLPVLRAVKMTRRTEMISYALNKLLFGRSEAGQLMESDFAVKFGVPFPREVRFRLERLRQMGALTAMPKTGYKPNVEVQESAFRIKQELMGIEKLYTRLCE